MGQDERVLFDCRGGTLEYSVHFSSPVSRRICTGGGGGMCVRVSECVCVCARQLVSEESDTIRSKY